MSNASTESSSALYINVFAERALRSYAIGSQFVRRRRQRYYYAGSIVRASAQLVENIEARQLQPPNVRHVDDELVLFGIPFGSPYLGIERIAALFEWEAHVG
ncbi:RNA polymerase II subunit A C-terminal domain phosphatase [Sarotherodon galilaeus]